MTPFFAVFNTWQKSLVSAHGGTKIKPVKQIGLYMYNYNFGRVRHLDFETR